jgi:hypothetical protein
MRKYPRVAKFEVVQEFCGKVYRNWIITIDWGLKISGPFERMFRTEREADEFMEVEMNCGARRA